LFFLSLRRFPVQAFFLALNTVILFLISAVFAILLTTDAIFIMSKHFSAEEKITLIQRFIAGESISGICKSAGISRTILYQWINAYEEANRR